MHIQDVPQRYVPVLAKILQTRPNESQEALSQRVAQVTKTLPSSLRAGRLENFLLPPRGYLCKAHKFLHYDVVQTVLRHVQVEVGVRLNNVITECEMLTPEQYTRAMRLRELHVLWLDKRKVQSTLKRTIRDTKWKYQTDQCDACILSKITSDLQILLDLRWAFRSRATRAFVSTYGNPRLQQWVYVWIATLAGFVEASTKIEIDLDQILLQNDQEAILLKKTRAEIDVKKQWEKYKKHGRVVDGGYVTEVPHNYSYPIHSAPHDSKSPPAPGPQDTSETQVEDFVGDTDE